MKNQMESLAAVADDADGERQTKSHKRLVVKIVQHEVLIQTIQEAKDDQHEVVAVEETHGAEVMVKVAAGKLFLVSGREVKMTKKASNFLVQKTRWLHQITVITEMKMCFPKVGLTVFVMCRVGWKQLVSSSPVIWTAGSSRLKAKALSMRVGVRPLGLQ
tara:strand:+ start:372 stop:851 length:480 start_codon:yes stop_codon:yes gene_type:complete